MRLIGEVLVSDSECEIVESLACSLSRKREASFVECQEDLHTDGQPEKTPPASRKNIRGIEYGGGHRWSTKQF